MYLDRFYVLNNPSYSLELNVPDVLRVAATALASWVADKALPEHAQ